MFIFFTNESLVNNCATRCLNFIVDYITCSLQKNEQIENYFGLTSRFKKENNLINNFNQNINGFLQR